IVGVDPLLGPLNFNGGRTETMMPAALSPAIDAGDKDLVPPGILTDQRGAPRIYGAAVDIGAVERQAHGTIVVTTLNDEDNGTVSPLVGTGTSLREAIEFADADQGGGDTITFAPNLQGTIALAIGALTIHANMTIIGPGANTLTIDGQGAMQLVAVSQCTASISGLTFAHGNARDGSGGGIANFGANLSLSDCTLSDNSAGSGGGILNSSGIMTMTGCTVSN